MNVEYKLSGDDYMDKKSKWESITRSKSKIYERIALQSRREFCLNSRLDKASKEKGMSKNAYLLYIIEAALSLDGYGRNTLDIGKQSSSAQDIPEPEE